MSYFLDTNIIVACLRDRAPSAFQRIYAEPARSILLPLQVVAELRLGAARSANPVRSRLRVDQFIQPFAIVWPVEQTIEHYVQIRAALEQAGMPISEPDLWIAATTRSANGTLVTDNTGEFARVPGLRLENWLKG